MIFGINSYEMEELTAICEHIHAHTHTHVLATTQKLKYVCTQ